ncbi:MAG TPA: hypothetical protein VGI56_13905 [Galbitalea sp.]
MTDQSDALIKALGTKSTLTVMSGTFVSASAATLLVDCGNGRIPCFPLVPYLPNVGETVYVVFIDDVPYVAGPTLVKPNEGTVVSVASGLVTLTTNLGNFTLPYTTTITPTAGQVMYILWQGGQGFAVSVMSTVPGAATPPPAPPAAGSSPTTHVQTFTAIQSGSYQSGRFWTSEVYSSTGNLGEWIYGHKIADTIPASATTRGIQIYISPKQIFGSDPNFALHSDTSLSGSPSLGGVTAVPISGGWISLPSSYAAALKHGGGSFGVGVAHGGYNIFRSLAEDGQSGALKITSVY